ncbi:unnamed protein product [Psylliodes chrysocephalus]|nr:unnamed protein product [Psylliodes chrysocephala]
MVTSAQMIDLFNSTNTGKSVLEVYKHSTFQRAHRQTIADIIIRNELEGQPDKRISGNRFMELSEMIVQLFPTEYKQIYFSKEKIEKNKKIETVAKGKLVSKFYTLRRSFRDCGLLPKDGKQKSDTNLPTTDDENTHEDIILWLKNSTEPWTTVEENWTKTSKIRANDLLHPGKLVQYFESFPCLRSEKGYLLVEIDFNILFPDHGMNLFNSWESISSKIVEHASRDIFSKDNAIKELLDDLTADISSDARANIVMLLLTYILPTISIRKGKPAGRWRPSRLEVAEGFWLRLKNISELAQAVNNKVEKLQKLGLCVQPLVIVVGPSNTEIQSVYVRIDQHMFPMPSCLKALDICFKSFHALHAEYARESEQIWTFIQQGIYKLHTKWDKSFTGVNSLLADLKL